MKTYKVTLFFEGDEKGRDLFITARTAAQAMKKARIATGGKAVIDSATVVLK